MKKDSDTMSQEGKLQRETAGFVKLFNTQGKFYKLPYERKLVVLPLHPNGYLDNKEAWKLAAVVVLF